VSELSTKPYLIRAIHEWCADSGYRAHIAVAVDENTRVPMEFVRNGEIVLNISADATNRLQIGNELIEFEARFNRIARQISVPIANVSAVYAAETGHGMAFDVAKPLALAPSPQPSFTPTLRPSLAPTPLPSSAPTLPPAVSFVMSREWRPSSRQDGCGSGASRATIGWRRASSVCRRSVATR
jgi:stringent starvation protein B